MNKERLLRIAKRVYAENMNKKDVMDWFEDIEVTIKNMQTDLPAMKKVYKQMKKDWKDGKFDESVWNDYKRKMRHLYAQ